MEEIYTSQRREKNLQNKYSFGNIIDLSLKVQFSSQTQQSSSKKRNQLSAQFKLKPNKFQVEQRQPRNYIHSLSSHLPEKNVKFQHLPKLQEPPFILKGKGKHFKKNSVANLLVSVDKISKTRSSSIVNSDKQSHIKTRPNSKHSTQNISRLEKYLQTLKRGQKKRQRYQQEKQNKNRKNTELTKLKNNYRALKLDNETTQQRLRSNKIFQDALNQLVKNQENLLKGKTHI